jgi:type 1 fimbria pilin
MKKDFFKILMMLLSLVFLSSASWAADSKPKKVQKPKGHLSNDLSFDGSVVKGQYQIADGSTAIVENEKSLNSLIDNRKDFKDRMRQERISQ